MCGGIGANCEFNNNNACNSASSLICILDRCAPPSMIGDPCDQDSDCSGSAGCSPISFTCGSINAACTDNADCDGTIDLSCILDLCQSIGSLGSACDPGDSADCQGALSCGIDQGGYATCGGPEAGDQEVNMNQYIFSSHRF